MGKTQIFSGKPPAVKKGFLKNVGENGLGISIEEEKKVREKPILPPLDMKDLAKNLGNTKL